MRSCVFNALPHGFYTGGLTATAGKSCLCLLFIAHLLGRKTGILHRTSSGEGETGSPQFSQRAARCLCITMVSEGLVLVK